MSIFSVCHQYFVLSLLFVRLLCVSPLLCFSRSLFFSIPGPPPPPYYPPLINLHEIDHLQLLIVQYFACLALSRWCFELTVC